MNPTSSSSMKPALQNQNTSSRVVIRADLRDKTAMNSPIRMPRDNVERKNLYRGTRRRESLNKEAWRGS